VPDRSAVRSQGVQAGDNTALPHAAGRKLLKSAGVVSKSALPVIDGGPTWNVVPSQGLILQHWRCTTNQHACLVPFAHSISK
jgi:hypothetical protein